VPAEAAALLERVRRGVDGLLVHGHEGGAAAGPEHGDAPLARQLLALTDQDVAHPRRQVRRQLLHDPDQRDVGAGRDVAVDGGLALEVGQALEHRDDDERGVGVGGQREPLDGAGDLHEHALAEGRRLHGSAR
jgi:hypothetical protein